jgi:hypothetical protein
MLMVYDELVRILSQLLTKQLFRRYPMLKEKFHAVVNSAGEEPDEL